MVQFTQASLPCCSSCWAGYPCVIAPDAGAKTAGGEGIVTISTRWRFAVGIGEMRYCLFITVKRFVGHFSLGLALM